MNYRSIKTFRYPRVKPGMNGHSKSGKRVLFYFPDIEPPEVIGYCRGEPAYGGVHYEWADDLGDQVRNGNDEAIAPSHWAPLPRRPR